MKNRPSISRTVFLSFFCLMFFSISVMSAFAQDRPTYSYSGKELTDFDRLTIDEKIRRFESLSLEEKTIFFRTRKNQGFLIASARRKNRISLKA